jgi:hypothetical protein
VRCEGCNKFCSFSPSDENPSADDYSVEEADESTVSITASVSLTYNSECCGDEVASDEYDINDSFEFEHAEGCAFLDEEDESADFSLISIESIECEFEERFRTHDRKGKPIKRARYQRHYYGVRFTGTAKCSSCGESSEFDFLCENGPPEPSY